MKKKIFFILLSLLLLTSCSSKNSIVPEQTSDINTVNETSDTSVDKVPINNTDTDTIYVPNNSTVEQSLSLATKEGQIVSGKRYSESFDSYDNLIFVTVEKENPYYIGKQETSWIDSMEGKYDFVVYLTLPLYLPQRYGTKNSYSISDSTIAIINGYELVPLKQGIVELTITKEDGSTQTERIAITDYNDGMDVANKKSFSYEELVAFQEMKNAEQWRDMINTIPDMIMYLEARLYCYDNREPDFCGIDGWQWTPSGDAISTYNGGVCVQVAQCANYMLAGNFEDWGNIIVFGNQGHIFNWFYEDGKYYIMDFTQVISDNCQYSNVTAYRTFRNSIESYDSLNEILEYVQCQKVNCAQNYLVCMYSCQGHDYMPLWKDAGISGSNILYECPEDEYIFGFEDVVMDDLVVLWQDPNINITIRGYTAEELNLALRASNVATYSSQVNYYFDYSN